MNYNIIFHKDPLGTYRIHENSESSNVEKNINSICNVIRKHFKNNNLNNKEKIIHYLMYGKLLEKYIKEVIKI